MKKAILILAIVAVLGGVGYETYPKWQAYMPWGSRTQAAQKMPNPVVDTITVARQKINPRASFVAKIESRDRVGLRARVTGFLQAKLFNEGDLVKQGQPLFLIERVNFEAQLRQAEANLAKAEAAAVNAKAQYERIKTLFKTKDVSAAKLDEAKAAHDSAEATVAQMKASVDLAKKDLEYTTIVAPMDGKIGEKNFSVGELIGPNSGVLAEVVSIDPMDAVFSVSENQLLTLQEQFGKEEDTDVAFITSNGKTYPEMGQINFVDVELDEAMNTLKMKASFPNPNHRLIAGQYGRVELTGKKLIDKIVVPMRVVQRDLNGAYVYRVDGDNKIVKQTVQPGIELPDFQVVIDDGLNVGDTVVVAGFQKIAPGATVQVNPVP